MVSRMDFCNNDVLRGEKISILVHVPKTPIVAKDVVEEDPPLNTNGKESMGVNDVP